MDATSRLGLGMKGEYMLAVKRPAITATGTLNGTEIGLMENHCHGQKFRFVKKILKN